MKARTPKEERSRLEKYLERCQNQLNQTTKPAMIDFIKRDMVKTQKKIDGTM